MRGEKAATLGIGRVSAATHPRITARGMLNAGIGFREVSRDEASVLEFMSSMGPTAMVPRIAQAGLPFSGYCRSPFRGRVGIRLPPTPVGTENRRRET
jgi:hypothetical protein